MAGGRALGVMLISRNDIAAAFTEDDRAALGDLATQAAVAMDNARLFSEAQAERRRSTRRSSRWPAW